MLLTEWNWDDALDVRFEEGCEEGGNKKAEEIARNALAKNIPIETVMEITGLDIETIRNLQV
jgi:predicted transposase/invertase (TIGR01784 family)